MVLHYHLFFFFFQAEDGIRDLTVTGVQTCALPISTTTSAPFELSKTITRSRSVSMVRNIARLPHPRLPFPRGRFRSPGARRTRPVATQEPSPREGRPLGRHGEGPRRGQGRRGLVHVPAPR